MTVIVSSRVVKWSISLPSDPVVVISLFTALAEVVDIELCSMVDAVSVVDVVGGVWVLLLLGVDTFSSSTVNEEAVFVAAVACRLISF